MRASFQGLLRIGPMSIALKAFAFAGKPNDVPIVTLHTPCASKVSEIKWCPRCNRPAANELVRAFESGGRYFPIPDHDSVKIERDEMITCHGSIPLQDVDDAIIDRRYYLVPDDPLEVSAYASLTAALRAMKYGLIVRYISYGSDHLGIVRPGSRGLELDALFFLDETNQVPHEQTDPIKISKEDLAAAKRLVASVKTVWAHEHYQSIARSRRLEMARAIIEEAGHDQQRKRKAS